MYLGTNEVEKQLIESQLDALEGKWMEGNEQ